MFRHKKGFTLIELLVVIAIIGLLASVSLASLRIARAKAADAKIKEQMSQIRTQAALYHDSQNPPSYTGLFTDPTVLNLFNTAETTSGVDAHYGVCGDQPPYWWAKVWLTVNPDKAWYIDGTGKSEEMDAQLHVITDYCGTILVPE